MCKLSEPRKLPVVNFDFFQWQPLKRISILDFSFKIMAFRIKFADWMMKENLIFLPIGIWNIIMHTDYESFWHHQYGLSMHYFVSVVFFLFVNKSPMELRQSFWLLFYTKPVFDANGLIGSDHPYYIVYDRFRKEDVDKVIENGAFFNLSTMKDEAFINYWPAFNVWGCRGVFNNHLNFRRILLDNLKMVFFNEDAMVTISWPEEEEEEMIG